MGNLKRLLSQRDDPVIGCLQYVTAWLAMLDDDLDAREKKLLDEIFGTTGPDHARAVHEAAKQQDPDDLAIACSGLRALDARGKNLALEYAVMVAVADQRLTVGENHALRFLADVLEFNPSDLDSTYQQFTGRSLPLPNDMARADSWKRKQGAGDRSRKSTGGDSRKDNSDREHAGGRTSGDASGDTRMSRADAAKILGVAPDASQEEIKKAYRHLAQRTHPDRFRTLGDEAMQTAQHWFNRVTKAYERLQKSS